MNEPRLISAITSSGEMVEHDPEMWDRVHMRLVAARHQFQIGEGHMAQPENPPVDRATIEATAALVAEFRTATETRQAEIAGLLHINEPFQREFDGEPDP
jgi:hypothetical protein